MAGLAFDDVTRHFTIGKHKTGHQSPALSIRIGAEGEI